MVPFCKNVNKYEQKIIFRQWGVGGIHLLPEGGPTVSHFDNSLCGLINTLYNAQQSELSLKLYHRYVWASKFHSGTNKGFGQLLKTDIQLKAPFYEILDIAQLHVDHKLYIILSSP